MTHQNQHQEVAQKLIAAYQGPEPLAAHLKKYFAANKKHGSKDRKSISAFCYAHFRDGEIVFPLVQNISTEINVKQFVASHQEQPLLFKQVPLKYIASYIGITPQALSRIRKRIS